MSEDLRNELAELRRRHAALEAETDALRRDATETAQDLLRVIDEQRALLDSTNEVSSAIAAIRASNVGKLARALDRWQDRTRRLRARWRSASQARARTRTLDVPDAVRRAPLGVNVAGYVSAESGMGEATRCSIRALRRAGIPVVLNNVIGRQRTADASFTDFTEQNPHPFNLIHLNADNMAWFAADHGSAYFHHHYSIGYWFWELETFRPDWVPAFDYVDEVWVASEHSRKAIGRDAPVPVVHMPLGLSEPVAGPFTRAHFGLPETAFVCLFAFDVSSQMERKNPFGAVRAFRWAGLDHDEAVLVLKFTNGHFDRDAVRRLAEAAAGLNVIMLDGAMDRPELNALMQVSDCCLSLHRAEGFGLTIAEHMLMGKPAVATAYAGNLDFMTPDVSCLVDSRPVSIPRNYGPYFRGYVWAEPDVEQAGAYLRQLARDPARARAIGERGRAWVRQVLSPARSARLMRSRLERIQAGELVTDGLAPPVDARPELTA